MTDLLTTGWAYAYACLLALAIATSCYSLTHSHAALDAGVAELEHRLRLMPRTSH